MEKDLKGELSGKFEDVVLLSMMDLPTMLATSLYNAMEGAGTKEMALIQVLVPFSNTIIQQTVQAYLKGEYFLVHLPQLSFSYPSSPTACLVHA